MAVRRRRESVSENDHDYSTPMLAEKSTNATASGTVLTSKNEEDKTK